MFAKLCPRSILGLVYVVSFVKFTVLTDALKRNVTDCFEHVYIKSKSHKEIYEYNVFETVYAAIISRTSFCTEESM
jgi:hypothetical protein